MFNRSIVAAVLLAAAGDTARGMAAAPVAPKPPTVEPTAPAAKGNRFDRAFGLPMFKAAENDTVYTNERSGMKSKKLASVMVEVAGTGGYLKGSIYAKQKRGADKATAEFTFFGANNQTCFSVDDAAAKAELDAWRATAAAEYIKWSAQTGNQTTAAIATGAALEISL